MRCFDVQDSTLVVRSQVRTSDGRKVLVDGGDSSPIRLFIERGELSLERDDLEPATKRRKVSGKTSKKSEESELVPLGRVVLKLDFTSPEDSTTQLPSALSSVQHSSLAVKLQHISNDIDGLRLIFVHNSKSGTILEIYTAGVNAHTYEALALCCAGPTAKDGRPASRYQCSISRTSESSYNLIKIEAIVGWVNGRSAFSSGAPVGRTRVYEDYNTYSYFFPDTSRSLTDHSEAWGPQDFYESVHTPSNNIQSNIDPDISATLFPFQKRTVQWMLDKERGVGSSLALYEEGHDLQGNLIYHNALQGIISRSILDNGIINLRGGILAEEMGLGKTVEVMSLITEHPRSLPLNLTSHDSRFDNEIKPSIATLIITPSTILQQWTTELARHAPTLKIYHYTGIKNEQSHTDQELLDMLAYDYDVILTTYNTLRTEIHFAKDPPDRNMRRSRKYERKRSPLVQIQWWRVCLDEAQMVESGVSAAAQVACRLPRVNSWAISGTPVKKDIEDLFGLLVFLQLEPFASRRDLWNHLVINHRHIFKKLFNTIAIRHTKAQIREDIHLPPQKRIVMTLPFTAIESQHYQTLFNEMCEEVGVQQDGSPSLESWDPEDSQVIEVMRSWLLRLRQTCLHPQVGGRIRRRLGRGQGALRTVAEVLDVMVDQNETSIRSEQRAAIQSMLLRGHIIANAKDDTHRSQKALVIYREAQIGCQRIVEECRASITLAAAADINDTSSEEEDSSSESVIQLGRLRNRLHTALQMLHVSIYFAATATYQVKVNEDITTAKSEAFQKLEEEEVQLYEQAKIIRREILKDAADKSERMMRKIKNLRSTDTLVTFPVFHDLSKSGGIETRRIVSDSYELFDLIRAIHPHIIDWRARIMDILTKGLVDEEDETNEITGDEYEESTKQQDELYVYFDALKALQADLNRCITGESAPLIDHEAKTLVKSAKRWLDPEVAPEFKEQCHAPELLLKLFAIRQGFRTKLENLTSIRGLIAEARQLQEPGTLGVRQAVEGELAKQILHNLQAILSGYTKALARLQKEVELCGTTQNTRLEFYRQLQEVSDDVAPYREELDETLDSDTLERVMNDEEFHLKNLAQLRTKQRFLSHLKEESGQDDEARICVICQSGFENGVLTVCGHQYCKECIQHWWLQHRTCPVCKRKLALIDFHNITYKPREVKMQEEIQTNTEPLNESISRSTSIYSEMDTKLMDQIKSFDLPSSYGTKIDTLSRHLLWLREQDPGAKSIVFSQYREFLDVLASAFSEFKIGFSRLGKKDAVERFRQEASIDCLLLDAKTDSSGLTLVNATHVFICEPLVQTAVELQAIARVHRIGQTRPTTVWMYLVNDTVEESIYEISVNRRMAHVQARQAPKAFQKSRSSTPAPFGEQAIDAANTEEMQNAPLAKLLTTGKSGGELVEKSDLWQCLFGKAKRVVPMMADVQHEVDRNLRAQAAENRAHR